MTSLLTAVDLAERGLVPTPVVRLGIRAIVRRRLRQQRSRGLPLPTWIARMAASPIALQTRAANEQHYEVPAEFFQLVLGPALKYSAAFWPDASATLAEAERAMLDLTVERASLSDGQQILELGCGWGSLTLAMARCFPHARVLGVSNSTRQRSFILARAGGEGLRNVEIETADMNAFRTRQRFDRVVSVEMFEHMRNWHELLRRIHGWLQPDGALFVHVFAHARYAYPYETAGEDDWMARHFFTGGMMPSDDLLPRVATDFQLEGHWRMSGVHYARTAEAWHQQLVDRRRQVLDVFAAELGHAAAWRAYQRWKIFFLACAELFGYGGGSEWLVSHYRLHPCVESHS